MPRRAEASGRAGSRVRGRVCCCAQAVSGAAVGLLLTWFQYGLLFRPYPPMCYFIQEYVIVSKADDDGSVKITDAPALIHSYVDTPGLKVHYKNIRAILRIDQEGKNNVNPITRYIQLPDVDMGYERFYTWSIHFNSTVVPLKPNETFSTSQLITLEINMIMPWYSFWSIRSGVFHSVKITCSFDPKIINTPVKCDSASLSI